ncbi:MAG: DUF167 domain-containing protein [Acidobacteriota bacterium]
MAINVTETHGALIFNVRVIPRASKSEFVGELDGALKVRIASPPVDGAANAELVRLLAKKLGVSRGDISIIGGETSKNKRIKVSNVSQSRFDEVTQ